MLIVPAPDCEGPISLHGHTASVGFPRSAICNRTLLELKSTLTVFVLAAAGKPGALQDANQNLGRCAGVPPRDWGQFLERRRGNGRFIQSIGSEILVLLLVRGVGSL